MFGLGPTELIIIVFVILLIFGAKKLPQLAGGMGKSIKEFKKEIKKTAEEEEEEAKKEKEESQKKE